jgi:hypothetical protein
MKSEDRDDDFVREMLSRADRVEALEWLTNAPPAVHRNIGEMPQRDSVSFVRKLYKLGAKEVVAVDIGINRNYESTDTLIATLPDDPEAREAIFDFERPRVEAMGYDAYEDIGQRHLLVGFDGGGSLAFEARTKSRAKGTPGGKSTRAKGASAQELRPKTPQFRTIANEMMPKARPRSREKTRGINASAKLTEMWLRPDIYGDEVIDELAKQWRTSRKKLIEMRELMIQTMSLQSSDSEGGLGSPKSASPMDPAKARALVQSLVKELKSSTPVKPTKQNKKTTKQARARRSK